MIVTRYSYNVPQLGEVPAPQETGQGPKLFMILGSALALGLVGIVYLEVSQGWRPTARRRAWR